MYKSKYFSQKETSCRCGCGFNVSQFALEKLDKARDYAGIPFIINSGARCADWNIKVGGEVNSAHTLGEAFDIAFTDNLEMLKIIVALTKAGFNRIGLNFAKKFIHADIDIKLPNPAYWVYKEV
jgi:zinc D-Ala-D-Ala carboxypeptidase